MNERVRTILFVYFLAAISVVAYYPVLFNHIIDWEDADLFNVVASLLNGKIGIFSHAEYAPLELAFLAFLRSFSQYGYFLFHALSMIAHAVNAVMLFFLVRRLFVSERVACVASVLFAVHPIQLGTVAWLSAQDAVFSTLLLFLTCLVYLRFKRNGKLIWWWVVVGLSILFYAIGSPALYFILILIGCDVVIDSKLKVEHVTQKGILFLPWLVSLLFRAGGSGGFDYLLQLYYSSVAMARLGIGEFVLRVLVPFHDKLVATANEIALSTSMFGEPMLPLLFLLLAATVIWNRKRLPLVLIGFLFIAVTSLPLFSGRAAGEWVLTDRSFYLPAAGMFLVVGELLEKLILRLKGRRAVTWVLYVLCGYVVLTLVHTTRTQAQYWRDNTTFWDEAHEENPQDTFILTKRGMYYYSKFEIQNSLWNLNKVVELAPEEEQSYIHRGLVYLDAYKIESAVSDFRKAILLAPSDPAAYFDLGTAYTNYGKFDSAEAAFSKALELNPAFTQAFNGRGIAFAKAGNYVLALADYRETLKLDPDYAEAYANRAFTFLQLGNFQRALEDFRKQIDLAPNRFDAKIHYGFTELLTGDTAAAISQFSSAIRVDSANGTMYLLGVSKVFLKSQEEIEAGQRLFHRIGVQ